MAKMKRELAPEFKSEAVALLESSARLRRESMSAIRFHAVTKSIIAMCALLSRDLARMKFPYKNQAL
jgi:hypothetical protein